MHTQGDLSVRAYIGTQRLYLLKYKCHGTRLLKRNLGLSSQRKCESTTFTYKFMYLSQCYLTNKKQNKKTTKNK